MCISSLAGPPITEKGQVATLLEAGVTVGLGEVDASTARNARLNVAWVSHVHDKLHYIL
jgi:hypothetical protein